MCSPSQIISKAFALRALLILAASTQIHALLPRKADSISTSSTSASSTTSKGPDAMITAAPTYPVYTGAWGNQSVVLNTCSFTANQGNIEWEPCSIQVGSIQLSYFPEASGNTTYPKTHYVPEWDITMTSPSFYMRMNTITGFNDCGALGPTFINKVISMLITDVSTLPPYADATTHDRISTQERQLTLSDLLDCPSFSTDPAGISTNDHPVSDTYNRCHPFIKLPEQASAIGYPYWVHCAPVSYRMGVWDPPGPVPPVNGLFQSTASESYTSTSEPPSPASTRVAAIPTQTTTPAEVGLPTDSVAPVIATSASIPASVVAPLPGTTDVAVVATSAISITPSLPAPIPAQISSALVVVALPETSVLSQAPMGTSQSIIATVGREVISVVPGATTAQIGSQVLTAGGADVTLAGGEVATLGPSGSLLVMYPSGSTSVFLIPTAAPRLPVNDLAGASWVSGAGSSALVIGTQTVVAGGAAVTLSNHDVVSLGASGLIVQMPGGTVSTLVPTANIAVLIASIMGISVATTSALSTSSQASRPASSTLSFMSAYSLASFTSSSTSMNTAAGASSITKSTQLPQSTTARPSSSSTRWSSRASSTMPTASSHVVLQPLSSSLTSSNLLSSVSSRSGSVLSSLRPTSSVLPSGNSTQVLGTFKGVGSRNGVNLGIWVMVFMTVGLGFMGL